MKKLISIILIFLAHNANAQTKASKIEMSKDTTVKVDTTYSIHLTKDQFLNLINAIRSLDEKPSVINKWLEENIYKNTQLIIPKK